MVLAKELRSFFDHSDNFDDPRVERSRFFALWIPRNSRPVFQLTFANGATLLNSDPSPLMAKPYAAAEAVINKRCTWSALLSANLESCSLSDKYLKNKSK